MIVQVVRIQVLTICRGILLTMSKIDDPVLADPFGLGDRLWQTLNVMGCGRTPCVYDPDVGRGTQVRKLGLRYGKNPLRGSIPGHGCDAASCNLEHQIAVEADNLQRCLMNIVAK